MAALLSFILDLFFPPTPESQKLRALSAEEMCKQFPNAERPPFPFIISVFSYKDPLVKELVMAIKNKKNAHAVSCAAFALSRHLPPRAVLVPIPVSRRRRNERGYNQCELLIDEIVRINPAHSKNFKLLARAKDRGEQKIKNREERLQSTARIFTVNKVEIRDPIIIIDDVCTTGSTLKEARDALLQAGYKDVSALTIAH